MRVIAKRTLVEFYTKHPQAKVALEDWYEKVTKIFIRFVGTHAEYDKLKDASQVLI